MTALRCALHRRRPDRASQHAATCLRCQAAAARHRAMLRELRAMRDDDEPAPAGLVADVKAAAASAVPEGRSAGRTVAIAGGTAVAIAAAALAVRNRRAA